jgi:isopenicillin N synthase-like dioxygenase
MQVKFDSTIMAFLLAFQDLNTSLNQQEKQNLQEVAKQLDAQPKAWKSHIEQRLLGLIAANSELNQSYQFYKSQLDSVQEIPHDLLPNVAEINRLNVLESPAITRGFKPSSEAADYESQLNNFVVIVGNSQEPEDTVKQVKFLEKWKQFLSNPNSSN